MRRQQWQADSVKSHNSYLDDPRWATARDLVTRCQFEHCNEIVQQIERDHGKIDSSFPATRLTNSSQGNAWYCTAEPDPPESFDPLWDADESRGDPDEVVYGPDIDRILTDNQHFSGGITLGLIEPYDSEFGTHLCIARDGSGYRASYIYNQEVGWMLGTN
ncbi:hypothetical protein LCGC14_0845520 [marine sediment metagenome]|uniref:Uncharacterized protein n=1 Tax=marine sediment metagenome TaxID=412755 RepID=A0A0F9RWL4_9ZZZZ